MRKRSNSTDSKRTKIRRSCEVEAGFANDRDFAYICSEFTISNGIYYEKDS